MAEVSTKHVSACDVVASVPFDRSWFVDMARLPLDISRRLARLTKLREDFQEAEIERAARYGDILARGVAALSEMEIVMNLGNAEMALAGAVAKSRAELLNARRWLLTIATELARIERDEGPDTRPDDIQGNLF